MFILYDFMVINYELLKVITILPSLVAIDTVVVEI